MSPLIKPDLSNATDFSNLEPGPYDADITACDFGLSKTSGNPMITPTFMITVPGREKKVKKQAFLVINGEGAYGFGQLLRACGFDELAKAYADKSIPLDEKPDFNTDDLIGQKIKVVMDLQLYKGETRDYIKTYLKM